MREAKKATTKLSHLIKNTWAETKKGVDIRTKEQEEIVIAINETLSFLETYDMLRSENHKTYFIKRYLSLYNNMSQTGLSNKYCISQDCVGTYCTMYLKVFESNLRKVQNRKK